MVVGQSSPVITDPSPSNESRVGIHPSCSCSQSGSSFSKGMLVTIPKKTSNSGKFEDILSNGWLDAMKSSSPPPNRFIKDFSVGSTSDDADFAYSSWMAKHPSALSSLEHITKQADDKKMVIFLDYDGTLSPIVDDPDRAFMSNDMRSTVDSVAKHFPTAIISGRSRDKVYELVGLAKLHYAGSHGMDIMGPVQKGYTDLSNPMKSTNHQGKEATLFQPAKEFLPMIDEVVRTLVEVTRDIQGSKVENNKFCASVHYRNVDEKNWSTVAQRVHDTLKVYPRLRLTYGRKVLEVRPIIDWDKGKALEFLLASLGLKDNDGVIAIHIGDDRTDEDAFEVLREGKRGFGILVSQIPKETKASYSLRDPSEVKQFLNGLVKWREQKQRNS